MLVKDWAVAYSFSIRYKHLLRSGRPQETDKDIDHILGVNSGGEEDEDEDHSEDEESDNNDNQDGDIEEEGERGDRAHHGTPMNQYPPPGGYSNVSQYPHPYFISAPPLGQQGDRRNKGTTRGSEGPSQTSRPHEKQREMQAYSQFYQYGPALGPWGQPLPYTDFGGYGPYGSYGGHGTYGQRSDSTGAQSSHPEQHYGMAPNQHVNDRGSLRRTQDVSPSINKRIRTNPPQPYFASNRPDLPILNRPLHEDPQDVMGGTEAKHESYSPSTPPHTSENEIQDQAEEIAENHSAAALEAELRATQLELKVAQLQAKRAALSKKTNPN